MAKIHIIKTYDNHFVPASDKDYEIVKKFKTGVVYRGDITKPRSIKFHRKFFALVDYVYEQQRENGLGKVKYNNSEDVRVEIELKCGNYIEHITTKGKVVYIPKSIAFDKMGAVEFEELYNRAIDVILKDFIKGDTKENIEKQINIIMGFSG